MLNRLICTAMFCFAAAGCFTVAALLGANTVQAQPLLLTDKPDFTGVWTWNMQPGANPMQPLREASANLPFSPEMKPRIEEYREMARLSLENPGSMCVQFGMPQAMLFSGGYPMEIFQRPEQVTVIFEAYSEVRRIFIEPHPYKAEDEWPSMIGFSSGHWDGDTLVVVTSRLKEQLSGNFPHSADAVIEERYQLVEQPDGSSIIVNEWTLTDPAFYTEPVTNRREWKPLGKERHLVEYACMEDQWQARENELLERYRSGNPVIANQPEETP
jgi:hypothetical protein